MKNEYEFSRLKELKNSIPKKKRVVGINLSPEVVDYFKSLAEQTRLPYQKFDRFVPARLRQATQEVDNEIGSVTRVILRRRLTHGA